MLLAGVISSMENWHLSPTIWMAGSEHINYSLGYVGRFCLLLWVNLSSVFDSSFFSILCFSVKTGHITLYKRLTDMLMRRWSFKSPSVTRHHCTCTVYMCAIQYICSFEPGLRVLTERLGCMIAGDMLKTQIRRIALLQCSGGLTGLRRLNGRADDAYGYEISSCS